MKKLWKVKILIQYLLLGLLLALATACGGSSGDNNTDTGGPDTNGEEDTVNWNKVFDGGSHDEAGALAIDSDGNVYTAGMGQNLVSASSGRDWWIKKFNSNGVEDITNWNQKFDGNGGDDAATSIAIDSDGNVYVAGVGENLVNGSSDFDWWIKKFNSNGVEDTTNWNKKIDGNGGEDALLSIAIDSNGNVYVAGYGDNLVNESSDLDWWIKKFNSNGDEDITNWNKKIDGNGASDQLLSIAIDSNGNVYAAGSGNYLVSGSESGEDSSQVDWWIKKFNSNGDEDITNWNKKIDDNHKVEGATSIAIDSGGNVYVAGLGSDLVNGTSDFDWWIKKFNSNGDEDTTNWNKKFDGNGGVDIAHSIAIDSSGNIYVAGFGDNLVSASSSHDWWIKKFNSNGVEDTTNWNKKIDGNGNGGVDKAHSIAIGSGGNIYVTGSFDNLVSGTSNLNWWIKKFSP